VKKEMTDSIIMGGKRIREGKLDHEPGFKRRIVVGWPAKVRKRTWRLSELQSLASRVMAESRERRP